MKKNIHVVGAVIINAGKILCAQRPRTTTLTLLWEFLGGEIENDETGKEALIREIVEEMSCNIQVKDQVDHTVYEDDVSVVQLTTFYCDIKSGMPKLKEHHAIKWLEPKELQQLDWAPADIPAVEKLSMITL